jgi:hypothetical protein
MNSGECGSLTKIFVWKTRNVRSDNVFNYIEDRRAPDYLVYPGEKQMRFSPDRRPRRMFHHRRSGVAFKHVPDTRDSARLLPDLTPAKAKPAVIVIPIKTARG